MNGGVGKEGEGMCTRRREKWGGQKGKGSVNGVFYAGDRELTL